MNIKAQIKKVHCNENILLSELHFKHITLTYNEMPSNGKISICILF